MLQKISGIMRSCFEALRAFFTSIVRKMPFPFAAQSEFKALLQKHDLKKGEIQAFFQDRPLGHRKWLFKPHAPFFWRDPKAGDNPLSFLLIQEHVSLELLDDFFETCPEEVVSELFRGRDEASPLYWFFSHCLRTSFQKGEVSDLIATILCACPEEMEKHIFRPSTLFYLAKSPLLGGRVLKLLIEECPQEFESDFLKSYQGQSTLGQLILNPNANRRTRRIGYFMRKLLPKYCHSAREDSLRTSYGFKGKTILHKLAKDHPEMVSPELIHAFIEHCRNTELELLIDRVDCHNMTPLQYLFASKKSRQETIDILLIRARKLINKEVFDYNFKTN